MAAVRRETAEAESDGDVGAGAGAGAGAGSSTADRRASTGSAVGDAEASPYPTEQAFFGVCPLRFIEDILNAVDHSINDSVDEIETVMLNVLPPKSALAARGRKGKRKAKPVADPAKQLEKACDQLVTLMRKTFDKNFDIFEMYSLRNLLRVPQDALEPPVVDETVTPSTDYSAEYAAELDDRLELLREKVVQAAITRRELKNTIALFEKRLPRFEQRASQLKSVTATLEMRGVWPPGPAVKALASRAATMDELHIAVQEQLVSLQQSSAAARAAHAAAPAAADDTQDMGALEAAFDVDKGDVSMQVATTVTHHMGEFDDR